MFYKKLILKKLASTSVEVDTVCKEAVNDLDKGKLDILADIDYNSISYVLKNEYLYMKTSAFSMCDLSNLRYCLNLLHLLF